MVDYGVGKGIEKFLVARFDPMRLEVTMTKWYEIGKDWEKI